MLKKLVESVYAKRFISAITAIALFSAVLNINLFCTGAEAPKMNLLFDGTSDSVDYYGAKIGKRLVDNVSPDGSALMYTITDDSSPVGLAYINFNKSLSLSNMTINDIKNQQVFYYWVSIPSTLLMDFDARFNKEEYRCNANVTTYSTTTGEVKKYDDVYGFQLSGFEGYIMFDLKTAKYRFDWTNNFNYSWSQFVDRIYNTDKSSLSNLIFYQTNSICKNQDIVIDSVGFSDNIDSFLSYQKSRPLKTASPVANKMSGTVKKNQEIKLSSATEGAEIYYTLDSSDPVKSLTRIKYETLKDGSSPIMVTDVTAIRAVALKDGRYSSVSAFNYAVLADDTPNTSIANDGSDINKIGANEQAIGLSVVDGVSPSGSAYKTIGKADSGGQLFSMNIGGIYSSMDKNLLGICEAFSFWTSTMDGSDYSYLMRMKSEDCYLSGDFVTYNTITGELKEYNNTNVVTLSNFEGYVICKLQENQITSDWGGGDKYTWSQFVNKFYGFDAFMLYQDCALVKNRETIWDDLSFSISYDKLIDEIKSQPLRTAPPIANQIPGSLKYDTQIKLSTATEQAKIYYTLDGSDPENSKSSILYEERFMANGLYDSPIRLPQAWRDAGINADSNGMYTLRAVAASEQKNGNLQYSPQIKLFYSEEPLYDGDKEITLNDGSGVDGNKLSYYSEAVFNGEDGAEYKKGSKGDTDFGMKLTAKDLSKWASLIYYNIDTSLCKDSTGYNQFHNIQAISYRVQISGLASNKAFSASMIWGQEGCGLKNSDVYVVGDDGKVKVFKDTTGFSLGNGGYTIIHVIDDKTQIAGWAVKTEKFTDYNKKNKLQSLGYYVSPQEFPKGYTNPEIIFDDVTAYFDSVALFKELDIEGLLAEYDCGTYENSCMLVCNDASGFKLNGGLSDFSKGLTLERSDRSKDYRCLKVTTKDKDSFVTFTNCCKDLDAVLCDGVTFWVDAGESKGNVELGINLSDADAGKTENFEYSNKKWYYLINETGAAKRIYGKINIPAKFRGWVIVPGEHFNYIANKSEYVNGEVDFEKLSDFTVSIHNTFDGNNVIYLDDMSIYASFNSLIKAHARKWLSTVS